MISLNSVELNQWLPSWWGDFGGGLATSLAKKPQLQKLLCIGRQKENARGAALRSHGGRRWRRKSRRWGRPGKASSLWQGTERCGGNILLPYMPLRHKGHEWVGEWFHLSPAVSKKRHFSYIFIETKLSGSIHWWGKQKYQITNVGMKSKIVTFATKWTKLNIKYHDKFKTV